MKKLLCAVFALLVMCSSAQAAPARKYIGIIAPASCMSREEIDSGDAILRSHGINTKLGSHVYDVNSYLAGTDQQRADDINRMFQDDEVKAVLCTRGGYGSARILGKLDYDMIAKHPKPIIGFSDITALLNVLGERCNIPAIHGPMLCSLTRDYMNSDYTLTHVFAGLNGKVITGELPMPEGKKLSTLTPGKAEGVIRGGNLTVIASLIGTPYELKGDGALLLLEEIGEKPYRIDRMLNQLWQNGLLMRVNGILLGDFIDCDDNASNLARVLKRYAKLSGKPVITGMPAGHGKDNMYIPFGVHAVMTARKNGTASLIIGREKLTK